MNLFVVMFALLLATTAVVASVDDRYVPESFPHLLGKTVAEARAYFLTRPDLQPEFLVPGSPETDDFVFNRVRIYYDPETNIVTTLSSKG